MIELLLPATDLPFEVGALYSRREDIHGRFSGQRQGGISTPANFPFVILFTGEAGKQHGYHDFWDDDGILHYFGEGQKGDMLDRAGNRAIRAHIEKRKRLILFQMMGHGRPYRFLGEFKFIHAYEQHGVPDTAGKLRKAIVFKLEPVEAGFEPFQKKIQDRALPELGLMETSSLQVVDTRSKQTLFKRRLLTVEKECRITGIADLRFLRASHIKPWSKCSTGTERVDPYNGLLLSPDADYLFDRGWITFEDKGSLVRSSELPTDVANRIGLDLTPGRTCGDFTREQRTYLDYHRNAIYEKAFKRATDPIRELLSTTGG